jgi:hypothetical protein
MSLTFEQNLAFAADVIHAAERDLGRLSDGQRRDLVLDRMDISSTTARELVDAYGRQDGPRVRRIAGLRVEVDSSTQWATITDADGKPVGTLQRARVGSRDPKWTVYGMDGAKVAQGELIVRVVRELSASLDDDDEAAEQLTAEYGAAVPSFFAWWGENMEAFPTFEFAQSAYVIKFGAITPAGVSSLPTPRLLRVLELIQGPEANGDPENARLGDRIRVELAQRLTKAG